MRASLSLLLLLILSTSLSASELYVSPSGNDVNPGTIDRPVATLSHAQELARNAKASGPITVYLREGVYYLENPLVFTSADSGTLQAPVTYAAFKNEKPVISGGMKLPSPDWKSYTNGMMQTQVPENWTTDQLFVNGQLQIMARYPNFNPKIANYNGFSKDAFSPERVAKWSDPAGGFIHALHELKWGGFSYRILGKKPDGTLNYEGGWQNNRPAGMDKEHRFVENIFEELDAPGEWYLNEKTHTLYFYPPSGVDLKTALIEGVRLPNLVEFHGTNKEPVRFVALKGITFTQASRTFMETKEPLLRTDWAIYRGAAILFNGSEECALLDSTLTQLGGNAVFVNGFNRRDTIQGCHFYRVGAGGVNFVGDVGAVKNPLLNYGKTQKLSEIDMTTGPLTDNYPADCLVDDCLIHDTGTIEKQSAPINIDIAESITVRHCSIYHCPRAGINIGDGCFGGHLIDFCDVFDTVRETGDHGSFNAWGRDRWWNLGGVNLDKDIATKYPDLPKLDCHQTITLSNSRWRCDNGWDIDLDDGSSNYLIINNLCLHGGIKNREGFYRRVENNIMVNCDFHPHVWYADSGDVVVRNILRGYNPAVMKCHPWGKEIDFNLFEKPGQMIPTPATNAPKMSGWDSNSIEADPLFVDPAKGNYQVQSNSSALGLGFKNFPMDQFGVQKPELKAIALTPVLPVYGNAVIAPAGRDQTPLLWNGLTVRNIKDEGEMSVYGLPGVTGVLIMKIDATAAWATSGIQSNDVILEVNNQSISMIDDLKNITSGTDTQTLTISRGQNKIRFKTK